MSRHPFQRLESPSAGFSAMIHFLGICSFAASFKFLVDNPSLINESYGWHFQYLTIIGLSLATVTFTLGCMADITSSERLFRYKNVLSVCSTPLEVLITFLYWTIRSVDQRLVVPEFAPLSPLADVGFHLVPSVLLSLDFFLLSPPWKIRAPGATVISCVIAFSYWFWVEHCHRHNGWYPYPLFLLLTPPWRMALFSLSASLMTVNTMLLKLLYGKVNGDYVGKPL